MCVLFHSLNSMVYLPMGYVYCKKFVPPNIDTDEVLQSLRKELYLEKQRYSDIDWDAHRQTCAAIDEYSPLNPVMKVAQDFLSWYENNVLPNVPFLRRLREKSLDFVIEYIRAEDQQTNYVDIGPVNKALNMLSVWIASDCDSKSDEMKMHTLRVDDYIWVAEDGVKMQVRLYYSHFPYLQYDCLLRSL